MVVKEACQIVRPSIYDDPARVYGVMCLNICNLKHCVSVLIITNAVCTGVWESFAETACSGGAVTGIDPLTHSAHSKFNLGNET